MAPTLDTISNSNPPPVNTKVTFGLPSLLKETPQIAKTFAQGTVYLVGIANIALFAFPQIPAPIKVAISGYTGGAMVFINAVCQMFGIQVTNPQSPKQ